MVGNPPISQGEVLAEAVERRRHTAARTGPTPTGRVMEITSLECSYSQVDAISKWLGAACRTVQEQRDQFL
jgi:hypothetical protein